MIRKKTATIIATCLKVICKHCGECIENPLYERSNVWSPDECVPGATIHCSNCGNDNIVPNKIRVELGE